MQLPSTETELGIYRRTSRDRKRPTKNARERGCLRNWWSHTTGIKCSDLTKRTAEAFGITGK